MLNFLKNKLLIFILLILASIGLYIIHFLLFHDEHHIFIYLVGDIAFLPLEVLLVGLVIENLITRREKRERLEKLNMVIETFFSEFGKKLLLYVSGFDKNLEQIRSILKIKDNKKTIDFKQACIELKSYKPHIDVQSINLKKLSVFLCHKRHFLMNMLQNPNLLEHQAFTESIMALFHVTEELIARDLDALSPEDMAHTKVDIERAYTAIILQWLHYIKFVQKHYPYFYMFAMRTNPFNENSSLQDNWWEVDKTSF